MIFTFFFLFVLLNGLVFLYQAFRDKRYLLCVLVCVISLVLMAMGLGYFSLILS